MRSRAAPGARLAGWDARSATADCFARGDNE